MLSNAINGKVLVPIFVDGKTFAPPRSIGHFCSDVSQEEIEELSSRSDCYLVFVVKDYPAYSETRVNHLIAELGAIPNNLSIVFTEESQATREVPSIDQSFFTEFKITSVSFANITYFIRRHFGLDHVRAESIALRLSETFDAFDLPAHPSYFAGIPRDFLTRLIEANRRAELIELAVMGFLTIAVVDDDSKVRLSRTTRRRFLSNLLYRMELKGENLSSKNLVEIARSICIEHDYDVVPEKFLSAFFDFGILKYNGKYLEFGIPFIRSYLLAELLASNKSDALKYFDFESNDFDFLSFSLYCETAGGAEFVEICSERLQEDIVDFSRYAVHPRLKSERHALFDAEVSPQLLRNRSAIVGLKERFAKEADAMLSSDDDAEKKQELMDMKLSTRESVYHRHKEATPNKRNTGRRRIVRDLDLATILIGGGAEHLNRFQKRDLAEKIIKLSGLITNDWFRNIGDTDYFALKEEVYTDVRPRINEKYPNLSDEAVRKFVEFFVDIIELGEYMGVLPSMLTPIDDAACHAVLAATLEGVEDSSVEDELIKALWLISVDVSKGEKALKRVIKKMPRRAFNRIAVAQYLVGKAYWSASSGEERLEILAAAEMAVSEVKLTVAPPSG